MEPSKEGSMAASTALESAFNVESFIREYYNAWSGADEDHVMSYYAENVVLQIPGARMEGKEAVRDQFVRPFITAFPGNRHLVKNMIFGSGVVTVEFSFEAQHKGPFGGHAATGARVKLPGCGVYEYDSAKRQVTAGRIYFDVGTLLQTITDLPVNEKAAEALHVNERNLSLIINTIPTFAWSARPDGYRDFLNQRWLDYTGMTAEQGVGWGWAEAIHPDDRQRVVEYWQSCLAAGVPGETESRLRRFDGSYRWFVFRANPLRDESGRIVKWYGTNIDIEDRKRGEEALRARELSWRQIVDNIPGLVATLGATGEVEFLNRQILEYFGKTNDELKNWSLIGVVHPDDLPRVIEARTKSIEAGGIYEVEHRCRRADGVYRWFQVRGLPVRNTGGTITAWYLLLTDIDDRKKAEEALQSNERNLSLTLNSIPTFIAVCRSDGYILSVNQAALDYHDVSLQDVQKEDFRSRFFHPDDMERLREELKEALKRPQRFECEYRALGKDGKYRWFLVRYNPLLDDQGRIDRWYVTAFDIEDRKGTEEALRKSERQFRLLVETIPALVWRSTPGGDLDYLNHRAVEYLGHTAESLAGGRWLELVHPEHRDATLQRWLQSAATGTVYEDEYQLRRADGQYRWVQSVGEPFLDTEGRIANWYGLVFDIEDRKRAEDAQARQAGVQADVSAAFSKPTHLGEILHGCTEAIVRHLDAAFARIWMLNKDASMLELQASAGMYTRLDGSYSRIPVGDLKVGWIAREKKAHLTNDVMNDPRLNDKSWAQHNGMAAFAGYPLVVEDRLIGVVALFARRPLPDSILDTLASVADTLAQGIERKRAEAQVEQAYLRLAQAQRLSKTGSFTTDLLADEHNWSEELCRIFEFDPGTRVTTAAIRAVFHPEDLPLYEDAFKGAVDGRDRDIDITYRIITPSGNVKHLHAVAHLMEKIASRPVYIGAIQDVTESKVAEEALIRARSELAHMARVTTLSALTASIAHEINQPIAAAITSAGACLRWLNRDEPEVQRAREAAKRIEEDGKRAAEIITHLKSFYKKDVSPQREMVSVNDLVGEMLVLLRSEADRHSVVMRTELAADLPSVSADRVQLQQVLMNLMLNGMEAMSEQGGELKISTRREGGEVVVSVSDTGVGIPADKMEEIFNAFVTTKSGGTGMGLAISLTIIESHGGRLWATVNPGRGATFHFTLPTEPEAHQ
jgi:PAS domain S-box-containing protein